MDGLYLKKKKNWLHFILVKMIKKLFPFPITSQCLILMKVIDVYAVIFNLKLNRNVRIFS